MIIIAGSLRLAASDRAAYLAAVQDVTAQARTAPGCHDFVQAPDPLDPERILVFERWADDESLLAYRTSPGESPATPEILAADVAKYRISGVEAP